MMIKQALERCAVVAVMAAMIAAPAVAQQVSVKKVIETSTASNGAVIEYPKDGKAIISSIAVTMQPGARSSQHLHQVPVFVYVIQGRVAFEDAGGKRTELAAGQGFIEPVNISHHAEAVGFEPTRFVVVFMGAEPLKNIVEQ